MGYFIFGIQGFKYSSERFKSDAKAIFALY